jgi:hypothetical protein
MPDGLVQVRISPFSGGIAGIDDPDAIFETFMADRLPSVGGPGEPGAAGDPGATVDGPGSGAAQPPAEPLF